MGQVGTSFLVMFLLYLSCDLLTPLLPGIFQLDPDQSCEAVLRHGVGSGAGAVQSIARPAGAHVAITSDAGVTSALRTATVTGPKNRFEAALPRRHCTHETTRTPEDDRPFPPAHDRG
jgi:hypothetical protein